MDSKRDEPHAAHLDFVGLTGPEVRAVMGAIASGENFHGYIPETGLDFILRNYRQLATLGVLEAAWLDAYVHAPHFNQHGMLVVKAVFDACDRDRLRLLKPISAPYSSTDRLTLFRGCAGPVHTFGMSWSASLDKAIWYAAHHVAFYDLANPAVYVTTMSVADIYCQLDHYDDDFIAYSEEAWRINLPASEFKLDRQR